MVIEYSYKALNLPVWPPTRTVNTNVHTPAPWTMHHQGRTRKRTPMRANVLLAGPTAPHGHPQQPPAKEHPIPKQTRCLGPLPGSGWRVQHAATNSFWNRTVALTRERRRGSGDGGDDADDDRDGGEVDGGTSSAHRERKHMSAWCACVDGSMSRYGHVWAGGGGRTFARGVALAVREGHPSPAARLGPIHGMGRAARSRAHALSGHLNMRRAC